MNTTVLGQQSEIAAALQAEYEDDVIALLARKTGYVTIKALHEELSGFDSLADLASVMKSLFDQQKVVRRMSAEQTGPRNARRHSYEYAHLEKGVILPVSQEQLVGRMKELMKSASYDIFVPALHLVKINHLQSFKTGDAAQITETVMGFVDSGADNMWTGRTLILVSVLVKALVEIRDLGFLEFDLQIFINYLSLDTICGLQADTRLSLAAQNGITSYLDALPGYSAAKPLQSETTLEHHGYLQMILTRNLAKYAELSASTKVRKILRIEDKLVILTTVIKSVPHEIGDILNDIKIKLMGLYTGDSSRETKSSSADQLKVLEHLVNNAPDAVSALLKLVKEDLFPS